MYWTSNSCVKPAIVHVQISRHARAGVTTRRLRGRVQCSVGGTIPLAMLVAWVRDPRRMRPYGSVGFNACAECAREMGLLW